MKKIGCFNILRNQTTMSKKPKGPSVEDTLNKFEEKFRYVEKVTPIF